MATVVKVLTVSVSLESATFEDDLASEINIAIAALGGAFLTSFRVIAIYQLPGGGRTAIVGDNNEAKTIKKQRYTIFVEA